MTRAEKRDALLAALQEEPNRSDRAIAREVGVSHVTVAALRKKLTSGQIEDANGRIETGQRSGNGQIAGSGSVHRDGGQIDTDHSRPNGCPFCVDLAARTFGSAAKWLVERYPAHAIRGLMAALQQQLDANPESEIVINWEAGAAARDLARLWSTARLDEFREHLAAGKPTRMTETEKLSLWRNAKAPRSISIADDPARAAEKLWLFWGATPNKLHRLRFEIGRRTQAPQPEPPPRPKWDPEDGDVPF
jgi:hypothetical protein